MYTDGSGRRVVLRRGNAWTGRDVFSGVMLADGWIYGLSADGLSRFNPTTHVYEVVSSSHTLGDIRYYDGWIYYASSGSIYRMRPDGSERHLVINDDVRSFVVINNTIYYHNWDRRLISASVDGNSESILLYETVGRHIGEIDIAGGWIHLAHDYGVRIRMRLDGSNVQYMDDVIARR